MIEIENISKAFSGVQVLNGISGKFESGCCNLIIGASGTGKSVLLKCIVGLIEPDTGKSVYNGRDFTHGGESQRTEIRREMGMLFQGGALFDSKTVEQNIMFPLDVLTTMPKEEKLDRVNFCLQRVGLENINDRMPSEISGGMKKRVGIARSIVNMPNYLFCDEPNSGLDPQTAILIDELIKEITNEYKMTTIVVTHDMNSVIEIGDRVLFLYKGDKCWEGTNQEITNTGVKEVDDFVFANRMMSMARGDNKI